jgi:hypothetical protein
VGPDETVAGAIVVVAVAEEAVAGPIVVQVTKVCVAGAIVVSDQSVTGPVVFTEDGSVDVVEAIPRYQPVPTRCTAETLRARQRAKVRVKSNPDGSHSPSLQLVSLLAFAGPHHTTSLKTTISREQ